MIVRIISGIKVKRVWLQLLLGAKVPIAEKKVLQILHTRAVDPQMGVAPVNLLLLPLVMPGIIDITVTDIDSAHETTISIDHNDLPVISVVQRIRQKYEADLVKRISLHARRLQLANKFLANRTAPKGVINKTNPNTLPGFLHKYLLDLVAYHIVIIDIIFDVNMMPGVLQGCKNLREFLLSVHQQPERVTRSERTYAILKQKIYKAFCLPDRAHVALQI